jgi:hypothetical protein
MIIYSSKTHIDFEAPIQMTETQLEKFIKFMEGMYPSIEVVYDVEEKTKEMGDIERTFSKWTVDDYLSILESDSNENIENKTEKSEMAIKIKRGSFIPDFFSWIKSKGYSSTITKKMIKEYLRERGFE